MRWNKGKKRPPLVVLIPLIVWDLSWRALAVRRAIQIGDRKQIVPLLFANSLGLYPMFYLWTKRNAVPAHAAHEA